MHYLSSQPSTFVILQLENRLRQLEGRALSKLSGSAKGKGKIEPYDSNRKQGTPGLITAAKVFFISHNAEYFL